MTFLFLSPGNPHLVEPPSALERGYGEMSALHCGSHECVEPIKELHCM